MNRISLKKILIIINLGIVFIAYYFISSSSTINPDYTLVINEVCNNNFSTAPLNGYENADWIELYNASDEAINLENYSISDNVSDINKFVFPSLNLNPKETILLYAMGQNPGNTDSPCLNFKLSQGENIYLYDSQHNLIDSVSIPTIQENTSYARVMDGSAEWTHIIPTPAQTNNNCQLVQTVEISKPRFSLDSGFYYGLQQLILSADENMTIYYTLDGSEPTSESMMYVDPISLSNRTNEPNNLSARSDLSNRDCYRYAPDTLVDKITVIRAVTIDEYGNSSDIVTNTYIIDVQDNECYQNLPILSLVVNPDDFFNFETGLYVTGKDYFIFKDYREQWTGGDEEPTLNYEYRGRLYERPANFTLFDSEGNIQLQQDIGVRMRGNFTRHLSQKNFGLYAREMYSESSVFNTDIFGNNNKYHKMLLFSDRDCTKIRHELHSALLKDLNVDVQEFVRCNVFLNGEYWGVYSLAETYNEEYIHNYYNIPEDEITICESGLPQDLQFLINNENNLSDAELCSELMNRIDMDSLLDYYASMIYIDNYDWLPHNRYMWKSNTISTANPYQDGKWRFMVYDTELAEDDYDANTFEVGNGTCWQDDHIVQILMTSDDFRRQFVTTFMDLANTTFEKEHAHRVFYSILETCAHTMDAQGIRWGDDWADKVDSELEHLLDFYEYRFDYVTGYLKEEFELQGELVPIILENKDEYKGVIQVNSVVPTLQNNSWTGYYFSDYPITLSILENEPNTFLGWYDESEHLISNDKEICIYPDTEHYYQAVFK